MLCNGGHYANDPAKFVAMAAFLPAAGFLLMINHVRFAVPYGAPSVGCWAGRMVGAGERGRERAASRRLAVRAPGREQVARGRMTGLMGGGAAAAAGSARPLLPPSSCLQKATPAWRPQRHVNRPPLPCAHPPRRLLLALLQPLQPPTRPAGYFWSCSKFTLPIIALSGYVAQSVQWWVAGGVGVGRGACSGE